MEQMLWHEVKSSGPCRIVFKEYKIYASSGYVIEKDGEPIIICRYEADAERIIAMLNRKEPQPCCNSSPPSASRSYSSPSF